MENLTYEITHYDSHNHNDSNLSGFIVGFLVSDNHLKKQNGFQTIVKYSDSSGKTEQQIIQIAYNQIKADIKIWHDNLPKNNIIGSKFIPNE